MVTILSLIDVLKRVLLNKYTITAAIALGLFVAGYLKGVSVERKKHDVQIATEDAKAEVIQDKLEVTHDERVRKILSAPVPDLDAARMLSTWPDAPVAP